MPVRMLKIRLFLNFVGSEDNTEQPNPDKPELKIE